MYCQVLIWQMINKKEMNVLKSNHLAKIMIHHITMMLILILTMIYKNQSRANSISHSWDREVQVKVARHEMVKTRIIPHL